MKPAITVSCIALTMLISCKEPETTNDGPFSAPVKETNVFDVTITGELMECMGMGPEPFDCFAGLKDDGEKIVFSQGIRGYDFKEGVAEKISVKQIIYDTNSPLFPMDTSSIWYVLQ